MSGGLNKTFRQKMRGDLMGAKDPMTYLRGNLFKPNPNGSLGSGLLDVNIVQDGSQLMVKLAKAEKDRSGNSHAFKVYYCDNIEHKACNVTLGDDADFFMTPSLTGCTLEIKGNTITHYDGLMEPSKMPDLKTSTIGGGSGVRVWTNDKYWVSNVFGVRTKTGWEFFQQSYDMNETGPLAMEQVSRV
jgi:hypothetical protein